MNVPTRDALAWAFLAGIAALPAIRAIWCYRRDKYTLIQWVFWWMAVYFVRFQWRCATPAPLNVPNDGRGLVVICNHRSSIDPFFLQINFREIMHWMVAKEYVAHPIFGFFLRRCEVIPVNRGGVDNAATRSAIAIARGGGMIGMFPEGRINRTNDFMVSVRPGAILVALKAKARVLPIYIEGSPYAGTPWSPLFMRAQTKMLVGDLIDLAPYEGQERDSQLVRELLVKCVGEIARLAGVDDFQPELAGRQWRHRAEENVESRKS